MLVNGIVTTKETVKVEILPRNAWIELSKLLLEKFKIPHYYDTFEYKINQKGQIIRFIPEYGHQIDWKESVIMENQLLNNCH